MATFNLSVCLKCLSAEVEDARDVDSGVKAAGLGRRRSSVLSQDTALELPVLLSRVTLVFFCCRHHGCRRSLLFRWSVRVEERGAADRVSSRTRWIVGKVDGEPQGN